MNRSTNYNLYLPGNGDPRQISDISTNFETIDTALGNVALPAQKTTNCNDATDSNATYYCEGNTANAPTTDWYLLRPLCVSGVYAGQIAYLMNRQAGDILYFRQKNGSGWGSWRRITVEGFEPFKTVHVTLTGVSIPDYSSGNPTQAELDMSSYIPTGYSLWAANVTLPSGGVEYNLPWITNEGVAGTWIQRLSGSKIYLYNRTSGWGSTAYVTMFLRRN